MLAHNFPKSSTVVDGYGNASSGCVADTGEDLKVYIVPDCFIKESSSVIINCRSFFVLICIS